MTMQRTLAERIAAAFLWVAAFCFATGVFFSITLLFKSLPPTQPVAVGLVTIERVSKTKDYLGAALFFLLVPPLTIWFERIGQRIGQRLKGPGQIILFSIPFFLSPLLYLTTGKVGWVLILPATLAFIAPRAMQFVHEHRWIRRIFRDEDLRPYHALVFAEGMSWVLFRYLVTAKRMAHYPTLFLEIVFVALFLMLFWGAGLLIARLTEMTVGQSHREVFKRLSVAALPLVVLPFVAVVWVPTRNAFALIATLLLISAILAMRRNLSLPPTTARGLAAWLIIPALVYIVSYASTAQLSEWIDLFHRGESIGPASDYLRGKVPYRDVFALHGMLEDGLLDGWLMTLFGRSLDVAVMRSVILGGFLAVALWFLGLAVFDSIPLALLCVLMGSWTTAENNRTFFQVAAVALFWVALRRHNRFAAAAAGVVAAVALFFSYDIGLFTIIGALGCVIVLGFAARRVEWTGLSPLSAALWFVAGLFLGAAPFLVYLATRGALDDFAVTSFVSIPAIIDAVWSLPFPDLVSTFRTNLDLHSLADFVLFEKFHLILSPLTIVVAAVYLIQRFLRRRATTLDYALLVQTVFAAVAQRTAFGRAEFRHQYFAAFLIAPMLVLLALIFVRRLREMWDEGSDGARAFIATIAVVCVPIVGVLFWIPDLVNARLEDLIRYQPRILRLHRDSRAAEVAFRVLDVTDEIRRLTRPNEPIFDFSNQPAFYFFANRPNPTRFYQVPILSPRAFQAETISALEKSRTKVIIRTSPEDYDAFDGVTNDLRAQAVSAYIDDCFRFHRSIRGVELWTRMDKPCGNVARYVNRIVLPARSELARARRDRMVFPAVGSTPGSSGAFWVSDLTLHNPFRGSIPVRLRYVAGDTHIDRSVTLAPRQTMHWPDVVRSLFGAPMSVGALWIEHRAGQAPTASVKTRDSARPAKAAVESALTARDAATAGTDNAELTVVGIPGGSETGRRINAGVVNTGLIPATFRISARSRTGQAIGKSVESGVAEDGIWLVLDIERAIGVKLDESTTLRITAIAGTGVGFATAVSPDGDHEFIAAIPTQQ